MNYYNKFKPFVKDLFVMIMTLVLLYIGIMYNNLIQIRVSANILAVALIVIMVLYLIQLINTTVFRGVRAICDLLFSNYIDINAVFIQQIATRSSTFSDRYSDYKKGEGIKRIRTNYYNVIVGYNDKKITLITAEPVNLVENCSYTFKIGKTSHIILNYY